MNLEIVWTGRFKKDYKKAMKQGLPIEKLDMVIRLLASCVELPKEYKDIFFQVLGAGIVSVISFPIGY